VNFLRTHKIALLVGGLVLSLLVYGAVRPKIVEVDTAMVSEGPMEVAVLEDGRTEVRDLYTVAASISGRLERIELEAGDPVACRDVVARIRPAPARLLDSRSRDELEARVKAARVALDRADAQAEIAEAEVGQAERYVERDERRLRDGVIAPPVLEDTKHALSVRRREYAAALAARDMAAYDLELAQASLRASDAAEPEAMEIFALRSPIDGVVLGVHEESERVVNPGQPLVDLGDPRLLEVRCDLLSQDAVKVEPGQEARIEHWGGDRVLSGRVRRVEPSAFTKVSALGVDEQRVWVTIDFAEPQSREVASLGHAYRVEVRIVIWKEDSVRIVPIGAVFRSEDGWGAYRVSEEGRAELVEVELGRRNESVAQVLDGLEPGDEVVLHPGDRVEAGTRVKVRGE